MKKSFILLSSLMLLLGLTQPAHSMVAKNLDWGEAKVYFDFNGDTLRDVTYGITAGDSFSADIYIDGDDPLAGDGPIAFALNVIINSTLAFPTTAPGSPWLQGSFDPEIATSPLLLGSVDFTSTGAGTFELQLAFPSPDGDSFNSDGFPLDSFITLQNSEITASPVPLPGAVWLLGSGLLGFLGLRRKGSAS